MKILSSSRNKIIVLIIISLSIFTVWQFGLETVYTKALVDATNISLSVVKPDTRIELEKKLNTDINQFRVYTSFDGRKGNFPQETGGFLQPFILILSWQILLFLVLDRKTALKSLGINVGIYFLTQVIFLIMLTGYFSSTIQRYLFDIMLDSFYIVALILVIKDNIFYGVFLKKQA
jgi:hypothetical protein